jgi:hypothetical protein
MVGWVAISERTAPTLQATTGFRFATEWLRWIPRLRSREVQLLCLLNTFPQILLNP